MSNFIDLFILSRTAYSVCVVNITCVPLLFSTWMIIVTPKSFSVLNVSICALFVFLQIYFRVNVY